MNTTNTFRGVLLTAVMSVALSSAAWAQDAGGNATAGGQDASASRSMAGGGASAADAQLAAQLDKLTTMPEKAADGLFILDSANGNLFEVEFARLAQQKAQDPQIKELAQMIEKDHSQANQQLKTIATKMGLELPTSLPTQKQKMLQVLSAMSPSDFETCFLLDNKMIHAKDITSFADHQKSVKDEDLRKYITAVLPKLQAHGAHVSQLAAAKGFPTPMATGAMSGGGDAHAGHGGHDAHGAGSTGSGAAGSGSAAPAGSTQGQSPSSR